jgi:hypothetical protein
MKENRDYWFLKMANLDVKERTVVMVVVVVAEVLELQLMKMKMKMTMILVFLVSYRQCCFWWNHDQ